MCLLVANLPGIEAIAYPGLGKDVAGSGVGLELLAQIPYLNAATTYPAHQWSKLTVA